MNLESVREKILNGDTAEAFRILLADPQIKQSGYLNIIAVRKVEWKRYQDTKAAGTISIVEYQRMENDINMALLEIVGNLERLTHAGKRSGKKSKRAHVKSSEKKGKRPTHSQKPRVDVAQPIYFFIHYDKDQQLSFSIQGALAYQNQQNQHLRLDAQSLNLLLQLMARDIVTYHNCKDIEGRNSWRTRAKLEGQRLYQDLFEKFPDLMREFGRACTAAGDGKNLYLCFVGPRAYLGMPYELLCVNDRPMVTQYPMCRQVSGVSSTNPSFRDLLQRLTKTNSPLRVLMIASDTGGIQADGEVKALADLIQKTAEPLGIKTEVRLVLTEEASIDTVSKLLEQSPYHIVHYAGHGYFEEKVENSGLDFWDDPKTKHRKMRLTARELANRLQNSQTVLFYLSCCVGAMVGDEHLLHQNDYLGVMDAVVQAGVPVVLGYRWYLTDGGALKFASHFYNALLETQSPPVAALFARRELYMQDATDETWTSPILVVQKL